MMRTITAHGEIDRLFKQGSRTSHRVLIVLAIETPEARGPEGRVLVVAGKRIGSAVHRNRAKRVLREALRRAGAPWPGLDVALIAREGTGEARPDELDDALQRTTQHLPAARGRS